MCWPRANWLERTSVETLGWMRTPVPQADSISREVDCYPAFAIVMPIRGNARTHHLRAKSCPPCYGAQADKGVMGISPAYQAKGYGMRPDPTVFVVDDDQGALRSTQWLLESEGHRVEAYLSAKEFLQNYSPSQPGCLLLDFVMPEMNGLEVVRKMAERGCSLPTIVVTGSGNNDPRVRELASQVFAFLDKPSDPDELLRLVHRALNDGSGQGGT